MEHKENPTKEDLIEYFSPRIAIRKLHQDECGALMGLSKEEIDTINSAPISKSAKYKMYGNSIVVDVLYHIFRRLYIDTTPTKPKQPSLFDI